MALLKADCPQPTPAEQNPSAPSPPTHAGSPVAGPAVADGDLNHLQVGRVREVGASQLGVLRRQRGSQESMEQPAPNAQSCAAVVVAVRKVCHSSRHACYGHAVACYRLPARRTAHRAGGGDHLEWLELGDGLGDARVLLLQKNEGRGPARQHQVSGWDRGGALALLTCAHGSSAGASTSLATNACPCLPVRAWRPRATGSQRRASPSSTPRAAQTRLCVNGGGAWERGWQAGGEGAEHGGCYSTMHCQHGCTGITVQHGFTSCATCKHMTKHSSARANSGSRPHLAWCIPAAWGWARRRGCAARSAAA